MGDQLLCQLALVRNFVEVRGVPQLPRLIAQRLDQHRMRVPERIHRDTRGKVEVALALGRVQPAAFTALEGQRRAAIGRGDMGRG